MNSFYLFLKSYNTDLKKYRFIFNLIKISHLFKKLFVLYLNNKQYTFGNKKTKRYSLERKNS